MALTPRRDALRWLASAAAAALVDPGPVLGQLASAVPCADPATSGALLGTLPLYRGAITTQVFGAKYGGAGLDARLITDLSLLQPDRLITPNALAYIRSEQPPAAAARRGPWEIRSGGLARAAGPLSLDALVKNSRDMGPHLFECSGNANANNFGLMSVATWHGTPLADVVSRMRPTPEATAVLVNGVDHDGPMGRSMPGASWVFPLAALDTLGAALATRMNGEPLPPDHGAPVRLVVPGWYGCSWIKWVDEIRLIGPEEPPTGQMIEFAGRTHQRAPHRLALDFTPPDIQTAATPIRVEKRQGPSGLAYRVVGIVWGGTRPVDQLLIRFGSADRWKPFTVCPAPRTHTMWSLWEYQWKPEAPGTYEIALKAADPTVAQRRLELGYYRRQVTIEEV